MEANLVKIQGAPPDRCCGRNGGTHRYSDPETRRERRMWQRDSSPSFHMASRGTTPPNGRGITDHITTHTTKTTSTCRKQQSTIITSRHPPILFQYLLMTSIYIFIFGIVCRPAYGLSPSEDLSSQTESGVCSSIDIRNSPDNFNKLNGCRVIEGFLQILLMDKTNETDFVDLTFPELTEITDYLLMYRVRGLKTLSKLFPNLAVVRGLNLFNNYAIVLYQIWNLRTIGLYSLTDITRGSVRIEKNSNLCYVETIDWNRIVHSGKQANFMADNKLGCHLCPEYDGGGHPGSTMTMKCPVAPPIDKKDTQLRYLCWDANHCQKICPHDCPGRACTKTGKCCDSLCLGSCTDGHTTNCTVCKDYSYGDIRDRKCVTECPPHTFKHQERRCISEQECRNIKRPKDKPSKLLYPYKPIEGVCMLECPIYHEEVIINNLPTCKPCKGACRKECRGGNVNNVQVLQSLQGCTHITSSLEISVRRGENIIKELENGLGEIVEIKGMLKVNRASSLASLNFLKNLRVIKGLDDYNKPLEYGLFITYNQNLQELWNWTLHDPIAIEHGKLFFHFNPRLCFNKIEYLRPMAKESNFSDLEVSTTTNGDRTTCNMSVLNVTIDKIETQNVVISWKIQKYEDPRSLLSYLVHYIEAPTRNVSLFDGDACDDEGWTVNENQVEQNPNLTEYTSNLQRLQPYTQYAFYVKTFTIVSESVGAQSPIEYVRTLPGRPSPPRFVELYSSSPTEVVLSWDPPEIPSGNVTKYLLLLQVNKDDQEDQHTNYCDEISLMPLNTEKYEFRKRPQLKETTDQSKSDDKCQCEKKPVTNRDIADERIVFEDYLQNSVYQKKIVDDMNRKRRDLPENDGHEYFPDIKYSESDSDINYDELKTKKVDGYYESYFQVVHKNTSLVVSNLRHFTRYLVKIWACREVEKEEYITDDHKIQNCSRDTSTLVQTQLLHNANDIKNVNINIQNTNHSSSDIVQVKWEEPHSPNGVILFYKVFYTKVNSEKNTTDCITRQNYKRNKMHTITHLTPGNYSVRVVAVSAAGVGNYSSHSYFIIEESNGNVSTWVIILLVLMLLAIIVICAILLIRRYFAPPPNPPKTLIADVNPEYIYNIYVADEWEIPRVSIELKKELGEGSFGKVYEGTVRNLPKTSKMEVRCAVKTINEHATERERSDFLKEASVMKGFDTPHVVRLLGVVSSGQPTLVVMELMEFGDLKTYLRSHRLEQEKPSLNRIIQMAMEIADGMAYLAAKKYVHRDLAARNCMVAGDLKVKIGDFGMTRDIYETDYYRKGTKGLLPVRWMSPESLKDGVFSSNSDVWSYGVVLWEMATLCSQPYQGLSNDQVLRYVVDGGVMERPDNCPDRLYQLMQLTWQHRPEHRPTFIELVARLATEATPEFRESSFFYSPQGQEMYQALQQTTEVVEEEVEFAQSVSPKHMPMWNRATLVSAESDSSPVASTPRVSTSPLGSYRDRLRLVNFNDRTHGEPYELEALVGNNVSQSAPQPPIISSTSPSLSMAPNGYLVAHSNNNGNPISLGSLRC